MREIKFRAFLKEENRMVGLKKINFDLEKILYEDEILATYVSSNFEDAEILQYTGMKDMNGVDIFEGDILLQKTTEKFKQYNNSVWERRYIVEFGLHGSAIGWNLRDAKWKHARKAVGDFESDNKEGCYPYEIIGNIYENPELLEGKEE